MPTVETSGARGRRALGSPSLVLLLCLLSLALLAPSAPGQELSIESFPERGWLGQAVYEFLTAFSAEDAEALESYVTRYRDSTSLARTPAAGRVARHLQIRGMLGEVELVKVEKDSASEIRIVLHSPTAGGYFLMFFVESTEESEKIGSWGIQPTSAPTEEPTFVDPSLSWPERLEAQRERNHLPALAVAVARQGQPVESTVTGVRSLEAKSAVEANDRFHVGSVTKSMTASLVGRLVDQGRTRFDQTLRELLPDVPMHEGYAEVTLAMVLRHRAGLEALLEPSEERERGWSHPSTDPRAQRLALTRDVLAKEPIIAPGSAMLYSNAGYTVAAVIAEQITGESWESLIQQEIFDALDMTTAGFGWPATVDRPDQPRGHWADGDGTRVQEESGYDVGPALAPAGDVHCSVSDLARYGRAHLAALRGESDWLSQETAAELHRAGGVDPQNGYAMGWSLESDESGPIHVHPGSAGTFYAMLVLDPERDLVVAAAANSGALVIDAVIRELVSEIRNR